ncbi:MAG TPA: DUF1801 domain-containing protein [Brevundimonas sp.]|jgi:hypothetical protein|uniref:DUF1801 domain-containing protein n=1 Tax=Brevundimonas sp. TaxID=1871086 RepID=UPI002C5B3EDB|nr:DUF1801 domain-containing protein [Brevundimonas sp.]HRH19013.1 DUF1801 domain-containing protein [Brevundimonas sp.]
MTDAPKLLSGGNPQIAKGHGQAPVDAWITAAPGWKSTTAGALDGLITRLVPDVHKAVKWNSPLYGRDGQTWFLSFHAMTAYIKVAFHNGVALDPPPPVGSKQPRVRYLHLTEGEAVDTPQLAAWITQAAALPGEKM